MYSYSYCPSSDKCVADKWNKFNAWCNEPWIPGYKLQIIADCKAQVKEFCLSFVSSQTSEGTEYTATQSLSAGEVCEVFVDASVFNAHASFVGSSGNDDSDVGILYNGIGPGDLIEVKEG